MTSTKIRTTLARLDVVDSIKEVLNSEICYCPILRNLQREYDANVINNNTTRFRDLGTEDRNEVFVYLGRILESVITCELARFGLDVSKDRTSSGDVQLTLIFGRLKVHLERIVGLEVHTQVRKKANQWILLASNMV